MKNVHHSPLPITKRVKNCTKGSLEVTGGTTGHQGQGTPKCANSFPVSLQQHVLYFLTRTFNSQQLSSTLKVLCELQLNYIKIQSSVGIPDNEEFLDKLNPFVKFCLKDS